MVEALEKYGDWSRINPAEDGGSDTAGGLAVSNERSLRELEAMMAGTR